MASSTDCDVIIVNYNAGDALGESVASALAAGAARVIVVDNASDDGSLEALKRIVSDAPLTIICNDCNLGFAAGCNLGLHASNAPFLLFLNPDCILAPDSLSRLLGVLQSADDIGMAGGFLCNPDGSEQAGGRRRFPTPARAFMQAFGLNFLARLVGLSQPTSLPAAPIEVEAISGACMLVKRRVIEDVGSWDEGYFLHCEDLDWCMRFHEKGWKILYVPDAPVQHAKGLCSRSRPVFVEWHKHRGMLRFYRKFFSHSYPAPLWAFVTLGVWLRFSLMAAYYTMRRGPPWRSA